MLNTGLNRAPAVVGVACNMSASRAFRSSGPRSIIHASVSPAAGHTCAPRFAARHSHTLRSSTVAAASGNGSEEYDYDFFCIGAGSGGVRASRIAAGLGAKVAVCELPFDYKSSESKGGVGGTCVLRGCVPKKLLVYGSEYSEAFNDAKGFGWSGVSDAQHDWKHLMTAKREELDRLNGIYLKMLDGSGVDLVEGRGKLVDAHTVEVAGKQYSAKYILIGVGGRPHMIGIPGAEHCINSDDALELPECPKRIAIIGAGYIALEFAGIFNNFGSEAHVFYRKDLPLTGFDKEVRRFATEQYGTSGLHLHPATNPVSVEKLEDGRMKLTLKSGDEEWAETYDHVMLATGRKPNTANLGLEEAGVEMDKTGAIKVDESSQTTVPSVYAVGDVTDRINLTPVALMEGMAVARSLFSETPSKPDHSNVASAVFSQPNIASVGYTEEEAVDALGDLDLYTSSFRPMKNTISGNEGRAFMKLIVDANTDKVVGVHMVGPESAEIMQGMAVAVKMGVTKTQLDSVVGIHPSSAEEFVTMRTASRKVRNKEPVEV